MKVGWLVVAIAGSIVSYSYLPVQRKVLIDEIPFAVVEFSDYAGNLSACDQGGSVFNRLVQLSEAWRLFWESPLFGIGASNFGFRFCGEAIEFASPHSLFAQVFVEYGLLGSGLLILMFATIIRTFSRRMRSPEFGARSLAWGLFGVWMFVLVQVQSIGNLFYDYQVFMLTGLFVSCLYCGDRWAIQANRTRGLADRIRLALRSSPQRA
jgi:O-antigen ligase